ncbi:SDR family oxidoreductase [Amycolatopsis sp. cg5]|uniref:SDR family oxidoreductase n=1 Tax=Amycolatopsis sp. cg5 TaxID=3238802 RepID=UPI003523C8FB
MTQRQDFDGRVALVLGASAERGTGWAVAEALAANKARVVVGARSLEPLQKLAVKIDGHAVRCDVTSEQDIENIVAATVERYGRIDFAVNCAGLPVMGPISELGSESVELALRVNYYANFYFLKHAAAAMSDGGSVVVVTSAGSTHVIPPHFAYSCAKAAADCLVRYGALEYGPRNIKVNSIVPGAILSDMAWSYYSNPAVAQVHEREVPMRRLAMPADIADAVLWLCGPSFTTGLNLQVNGGNHLTRYPRPDELPADAFEGAGTVLFDRGQ